jgi:UDP-N-acetylglucosamine 2-epimerase (non-hydrolysing)
MTSTRPRLLAVAGARPNFMKIAPLLAAASRRGVRLPWVHTGQHYDEALSGAFLRDLGLPPPDESLGIGPGTAAAQTARILDRLPPILARRRTELLVVVGDVTSTLAAALAAVQSGVRVAHVEAGLRSFDESMPEERNRVLTDRVSSRLYVTEPSGLSNLAAEGIPRGRARLVGNPMIDALRTALPAIRARAAADAAAAGPGRPSGAVVVTLHRPSNVDAPKALARCVRAVAALAHRRPVLFPVHPRTRARLARGGLLRVLARAGVDVAPPLPYVEFLARVLVAPAVVTDSGGLQEETSFLGVPCLTLRTTTERPVTLTHGTNRLLGDDPRGLCAAVEAAIARPRPRRAPARLWDGKAGERIVDDLLAGEGRRA